MKQMHIKLKKLLGDSFFKDFMEETRIGKFEGNSLNPAVWPEKWKRVHYKNYPRFEKIVSGVGKDEIGDVLKSMLEGRNSQRSFSDESIKRDEIMNLVHYSVGLKEGGGNVDERRRYYPSAGARYPIETYLLIWGADDLKKGVYHYDVLSDALMHLWGLGNMKEELIEITGQNWVGKARAVLVLTAVHKRTTVKYTERGIRYVMFEAGHVAQNVYLICQELGLKCCAVGGFVDDKINDMLDLDVAEESALYMLAIGK